MRGGRRESLEECRARLSAAAGREIGDDELNDIMEIVQARMQSRIAAGESPQVAARTAGAEVATEARIQALVMKRERAISIAKRNGLMQDRTIPGREYDSLQGAMTGVVRRGRMLGLSADAVGKALVEDRIGALTKDLLHEDLLSAVAKRDPVLDREIMQEWWHIKRAEPATTNPIARKIAEIFEKHMEITRLALNEEGAWIGKLEHYVGRQMHDMMKVRGGFKPEDYLAWRDFIYPRLDPITFDHIIKFGELRGGVPATIDDFLKNVWTALSSGVHEQSNGSSWLGGFTGTSNLAKRLSQERVLHFKDPVGFHEYNARFGHGGVIDAVLRSIERGAHNVGIMKVFGTNPEATVKWWAGKLLKQASDRGDGKMVDRLDYEKSVKQTLQIMTGLANKPGNMTAAYYMQGVRNALSMAKLANVVISSINDIYATTATLKYNGVPIFQGYAHMVASMMPHGTRERREMATMFGGIVHGMLGDFHVKMRAADSPVGSLGKMTNAYFKLVGLNYWTDHTRVGVQTGIAARYAHYRNTSFDKLPPLMQTTLDRYGIGPGEWQALRQVPMRTGDGNHYLFPGDVALLPDDAVAGLGLARDPARAREELHTRYSTLLTDQAREGISEPTVGQRAGMTVNTAPGTIPGELVRSIMMFKSFMATFLMRSLGRELFRGETQMGRFNVNVPGIVHLAVGTTILGALSLTLADLAGGKNPRGLDTLGDYLKFVAAAIAKGGGLGIASDFIFGNTYGQMATSASDIVAGPLIGGPISDIGKTIASLESGHGNVPAELIGAAKRYQPYQFFYTRAAMEHLFYHGLQESVNPGYLRRIEQKAQRDYKQTYWLRPTEAVRY